MLSLWCATDSAFWNKISYYDTKKIKCFGTWNRVCVIPNQWLSHSLTLPFMLDVQFSPSSVKLPLNQLTHFTRKPTSRSGWHLTTKVWPQSTNSLLQETLSLPSDVDVTVHTLTVKRLHFLRAPQMMWRKWCGGRRTGSPLRRAGWGKHRKLTAYTWWGDFSLRHILQQ